jgi:hypothetical protein
MPEVLEKVAGFLLILLLPFVVIGGGILTLFAVGALFDALEHPHEVRGRIDGLFRQPLAPARMAGPGHYYQPYWSDRA